MYLALTYICHFDTDYSAHSYPQELTIELDNLFENHIPSPTSVMLSKRSLALAEVEEPQSA